MAYHPNNFFRRLLYGDYCGHRVTSYRGVTSLPLCKKHTKIYNEVLGIKCEKLKKIKEELDRAGE